MQRYIGRVEETTGKQESAQGRPKSQLRGQNDSMVLVLKDMWYLSLSNWKWFLLSVILSLGIGYYYLKITAPVYERSISILIKSGKDAGTETIMKELGLNSVPTNITNEMELLKTGPIASEIAKRLDLNVEYRRKGTFHDEVIYGAECPVKVSFLNFPENKKASFNLSISKDGKVTLEDMKVGKKSFDKQIVVNMNDTVDTPAGNLLITPTSGYKQGKTDNIQVYHSNINSVAREIQKGIAPHLRNKNTTIIDISYRDVSLTRAEDILNTLVQVYNENWIKDRNLQTTNTDKFIRERLAFIEDELGDVEQSISTWKSQNLMLNVDQAGDFAQSQINEAERELQELGNQTYMTRYIKDYLTDGKHNNQLLPANSGITNSSIERLIGEYNTTLLTRNNHLANSSAQNPLVKDMDENLTALRGSILQSLDYELTMLQSKANAIRSRQGVAISRVAANPQKAQQLLSVERQQKVKEELYLYLLEKREENELSQAFGAYNNQFIESPHGSGTPVEPRSVNIMLLAFGIGLFVPAIIIFASEIFNTKVRGKKDLEPLSAPYAGDIPLTGQPKKEKKGKKKDKQTQETPQVVVEEKNRDIINEAFRMLRTNLEFMLGYDVRHRIIMVTSLNPGSGKTFISANLATAVAIRNRKVLAIDLDLRKGSLSKYLDKPKLGISNYLNGQIQDYHDVILKMGKVDVLPTGTLPPNPAELLFSPRFKQLLDEVKEEYDFVFLDCPPVEVVADASIISKYADLTLFIVRVGNLERDNLPDIEEWYHDKKYGNLAIVINGIDSSTSRYGYHKYGYHKYGYHYGSYGYSSNE